MARENVPNYEGNMQHLINEDTHTAMTPEGEEELDNSRAYNEYTGHTHLTNEQAEAAEELAEYYDRKAAQEALRPENARLESKIQNYRHRSQALRNKINIAPRKEKEAGIIANLKRLISKL